jgi:putative restriction endonuclease
LPKGNRKIWTRDELILAINLYCKIPFGKIDSKNPELIHLANLIGRTPSAVAWKLANFASFDPSLKARGIKGATNSGALDKAIWTEFYEHWDDMAFQSELVLAKFEASSVETLNSISEDDLTPREGRTREQMVKLRVNQNFFRRTVLSSYNNKCCITGIQQPEFLVAGHIIPWSLDDKNRLNPRNGIAINGLHDKAFETGLITITPEFKIKVSSVLKGQSKSQVIREYFLQYEDKSISLPSRFVPDVEFLTYHNRERFKP